MGEKTPRVHSPGKRAAPEVPSFLVRVDDPVDRFPDCMGMFLDTYPASIDEFWLWARLDFGTEDQTVATRQYVVLKRRWEVQLSLHSAVLTLFLRGLKSPKESRAYVRSIDPDEDIDVTETFTNGADSRVDRTAGLKVAKEGNITASASTSETRKKETTTRRAFKDKKVRVSSHGHEWRPSWRFSSATSSPLIGRIEQRRLTALRISGAQGYSRAEVRTTFDGISVTVNDAAFAELKPEKKSVAAILIKKELCKELLAEPVCSAKLTVRTVSQG